MDPWPQITAVRQSFADYLGALAPEDWDKQSYCTGWSVKGVATHLLVTPTMSKGQVFKAFVGSGFSLNKMSQKMIDKMTASMSTDDIVKATKESAASQTMPPGLKPMGVLTEVLVHTGDIAEAVGKPFDAPAEAYAAALEDSKGVQPFLGCKNRIAGLRLEATDADWSTGEGPLVKGPAKQLLLAMCGRKPAYDLLEGDGVATLQTR